MPCTISEAALATSAASIFFDPVYIGNRQFVDGALGMNNPVEAVEEEACDIWCAKTRNIQPLVKCFISIGTGKREKMAIQEKFLPFIRETLIKVTTETEEKAKRSASRWKGHSVQNRYFRLNVEQKLQDVGLAEYKQQHVIEGATEQYLDEPQQILILDNCVANLKQKRSTCMKISWSG